MKLSQAQHQYLAQRASWYFDVDPRNIDDRGDTVVLTGDSLADLNSTLAFCRRYPKVRITCEVGQAVHAASTGVIPLGTAFASNQVCDLEDIEAIKTEYIAYWGSNGPDAYKIPVGDANQIP